MPTARNRLVSLADKPYYHCVSRCVRRADALARKAERHLSASPLSAAVTATRSTSPPTYKP